IWVKFAKAMAPITGPSSQFTAAQTPAEGPLKVLDIAASHGMYGIAVAKRNPQAQIYGLDWETVLECAKENAVKAGVGDRYHTIPGSAFEVDMGAEYDVVLIPNFLHHFDPPTNEVFLKRVHAALKPGGRAITIEFVPDEDRMGPLVAVRFALTMLTTTERGDAYTFAELEKMFRNAGFGANTLHRLDTQQSAIISTK
ncbi:MAG: class I SAM-dependent methyltransferase, partial [Acidobacteriota bacterium]|nr:class I SAM-dependent methyltransferase [Acidobacteriota bacterium]